MILDIELRHLTDGPNGAARYQVRKLVACDAIPRDVSHAQWTDWQDVPRVSQRDLQEAVND